MLEMLAGAAILALGVILGAGLRESSKGDKDA